MRILHTSDWHLGARICDKDRFEEQEKFLTWMIETIKSHSVDILLVSGDIFDSTNPPNSAEKLYFQFLTDLKETSCSAAVITGGNHDSISKLNSSKKLLSYMSIYVNGGINASHEENIFLIKNKEGNKLATVCAIPFLRERDIHIPTSGENWSVRESAINEGIKQYYHDSYDIAKSKSEGENIPIIAMGHLFVRGSSSGEGERDLYVGNLGSLDNGIFPKGFTYIALGHIHKAQVVNKEQHMRYCGSPLPMDFGETGQKKVILVDFKESEIESLSLVEVPIFRKLYRFKGSFEEICSEIENFEDPGIPFLVDAEVLGTEATGDISSLLNEKALLKGFEFLRIRIIKKISESIDPNESKLEIKDLSIEEVFVKKCIESGLDHSEIEELKPLHDELIHTIAHQEAHADEN